MDIAQTRKGRAFSLLFQVNAKETFIFQEEPVQSTETLMCELSSRFFVH